MKEIKDIYGNVIKAGDTISMPHVKEDWYTGKIVNGYYISKVSYDEKRDELVTECGNGFKFAYGVVKINY
jgi:hypothetical protein